MPRTTRRHFAATLAAAGAALPLLAQTPPAPPSPAAGPKPETQTPPPEERKPSPLGTALTDVVRAQYGEHLSAEEMETVGASLQSHAAMLERFRQFPLANADEPDFTFVPLAERW